MNVLKRVLLLLLCLLVVLLLFMTYLTTTHGGMQRLFSLGQSYTQGELSWGASSGSLKGPATLQQIAFAGDDGTAVNIEKARFDWKPKRLWSRKLEINNFQLNGVEIRLPPPSDAPAETSAPFQLQDLALPVGVNIEQFSITDVKVYPHGAESPVVIDRIELAADGRGDAVKLVRLSVSAPQGEFNMDGSVNTSGAWPVNLSQQWRIDHPQYGEFSGRGTLSGEIEALKLQHQIDGAARVNVDAMVSNITADLSWDGTVNVQSDDLAVFSEALTAVPLSATVLTSGSLQRYQATGKVNSAHSQTGPLALDFAVDGTLEEIAIEQALLSFEQSATVADVTGTVALADLQSEITVQWSDLQWPLVNGTAEPAGGNPTEAATLALVTSPAGTLRFTGTPADYKVSVDSSVSQSTTGVIDLTVDIDGNTQLINIHSIALDAVDGETDLDISGTVDVQNNLIDISGQWLDLGWPLQASAAHGAGKVLSSDKGQFSIGGSLDNYKIDAELSVDGQNIPAGQWQFSGHGNQQSIEDIKLQGLTLDGEVTGAGRADISPQPGWTLKLTTQDINPALKWPGSDGSIAMEISTSGTIADSGPDASVVINSLSGNYRQQPLSGAGQLRVRGDVVEIDRLSLTAGPAALSANGKLGDKLDVQWQLKTPALNKLSQQLRGAVDINGKLSGTMNNPAADFNVDVTDFDAAALQVQSIKGTGSLDLSGRAKSDLQLTVNNITAADQVWDRLRINGSGVPESHQATIALEGPLASVALNASGGVSGQTWKGSIDTLDLLKTAIGDWRLADSAVVAVSAAEVQADKFCLVNERSSEQASEQASESVSDPAGESSVCVDAGWSRSEGAAADIDIPALHASLFKQFMPADIDIDAAVSGSATVRTSATGKPAVTADLLIDGGELDYLDNGEPVNNKLGRSRLQFELRDDNLKSDLDLDFGDIGTVNGAATVAGLSTSKQLGGTLQTDIKDISIVSIFAPDMQSVDGKFNTDVQLGGTLDAPRVLGETALGGLVAEIPLIGMKVFDGTVNATSDGKGGLNIEGSVTAGTGELGVSGAFNPSSGDMEIRIKGEGFQLANTTRQRVAIDPDLLVKIEGDNMTVTGSLHIPSAYIQAGGEGAVIKESPDVIIVNAGEETAPEKPATKVTVDVKVTLGDDIRVKAGPFDGALAGGISIGQQPGGVPTGSGAIEVVSGDFLVYGQKLTMERGRILFGGGPIDNPALELDVARDVSAYEVKAGARVRGTAKAPLLQLQSDPAQTDANTLSFILFGKPLENAGVSYTLGKFITPDIYVSYGIDLFEKIQTYNLRYKVTDTLALVAAKNTSSSVDLIYTFER